MTTINKPMNYMRVYVTSEQFAKLYELTKRAELMGGREVDTEEVRRLLAQCAHENGGTYDVRWHREGGRVELSVIV